MVSTKVAPSVKPLLDLINMSLFLITYDLRQPGRNYQPLYDLLGTNWRASKVAESVWLLQITADAVTVRDTIHRVVDDNDRIIVIELKAGSMWATRTAMPDGAAWLQRNIP
jgi:CRISPR/Cas system-associated endoribonuclease Cas2